MPKLVNELPHSFHGAAHRDLQVVRNLLLRDDAVHTRGQSAEVLP